MPIQHDLCIAAGSNHGRAVRVASNRKVRRADKSKRSFTREELATSLFCRETRGETGATAGSIARFLKLGFAEEFFQFWRRRFAQEFFNPADLDRIQSATLRRIHVHLERGINHG